MYTRYTAVLVCVCTKYEFSVHFPCTPHSKVLGRGYEMVRAWRGGARVGRRAIEKNHDFEYNRTVHDGGAASRPEHLMALPYNVEQSLSVPSPLRRGAPHQARPPPAALGQRGPASRRHRHSIWPFPPPASFARAKWRQPESHVSPDGTPVRSSSATASSCLVSSRLIPSSL